ncbi:hypothetical protein [uncultured Dokdonia sp.]|nr:hypothetical protein [uncultured Dokdonia sp.]
MLESLKENQIQNLSIIFGGDNSYGRDHGDEDGVPPDGQLG